MSFKSFRRSGRAWRTKTDERVNAVIAAALATAITAVSLTGSLAAHSTGPETETQRQLRSETIAQAEERLGRKLHFKEFVDKVRPGYQWYKHCLVLADVLQKVAEGKIKRLMIFMPPRHGKSELASRLFTAYFLYLYPNRWAAICSYGQGMANTLSRAAKSNYLTGGLTLAKDARAVKQWETGQGGGLWCAGMRGEMTGKGWHLGVIDDPFKNATEAESPIIRDSVRENYQSAFYTREEPNELGVPDGALVVINTRWHEDDLSGWLLKQELSDDEDDQEHWHIVSFPAISEEPERDKQGNIVAAFPPTCTVEPDWRAPGEALCPERRPLHKLRRIMKKVGDYFWNAMFQPRPRPRDGGMFKRDWFQEVDSLPFKRLERGSEVEIAYTFVRYWDKAGTDGGGAYTAGVLLAMADTGEIYVVDVVRGQWSARVREQKILETAQKDDRMYGDGVVIWIEQEPGSGGLESAEETLRNLDGFTAHKEQPHGDKVLRAGPWATQCEAKNVWLVKGPWNAAFIDEHLSFPRGTYKDQVDAAGGAKAKLTAGKKRKVRFY